MNYISIKLLQKKKKKNQEALEVPAHSCVVEQAWVVGLQRPRKHQVAAAPLGGSSVLRLHKRDLMLGWHLKRTPLWLFSGLPMG